MKSKALAIFLSIFLILSFLPSATFASPFFVGDGTANNPYGISTIDQLDMVRFYPAAHFVLLNDIDMLEATSEGGDYWNDGKGWKPIGSLETPFSGVFEGGGFVISNLTIINPTENSIGLFGRNTGSILRLGLHDCQIVANDELYEQIFVGGITGINDGYIGECYFSGNILAACYHAEIGGIAGVNGIIEKCFNAGTISASGYYANIGGISGSYSTVRECYSAASMTLSGDNLGAIAGCAGTISNCYYTNPFLQGISLYTGSQTDSSYKTPEEMTRSSELTGLDFGSTWTMSGDDSYPCPVLQTVHFPIYVENSVDFDGGAGTIYNPFRIRTIEHLDNVRAFPGSHFKLVGDLDLSAATRAGGLFYNGGLGWIPIGGDQEFAFSGSFDGGQFAIRGLYSTYAVQGGTALFFRNDGILKNLALENVTINTTGKAAALAVKSYGLIDHCSSTGRITGKSDCGGIAAIAGGPITACFNSAAVSSISGAASAGGIVGSVEDNAWVQCSYNVGHVELLNASGISGIGAAGGIVGEGIYSDETRVENCFNTGSVFVEDKNDRAGGIVGNSINEINHCYNIGIIEGSEYSASIISKSPFNTITDTYFYDTGEEDLAGAVSGGVEYSVKLNYEQMLDQLSYEGFDFTDIWEMPASGWYLLPVLQTVAIDPLEGENDTFSGGLGTMAIPYIVSNPEQLNNIRDFNFKFFVLANDIDLTAATRSGGIFDHNGLGFEPIGSNYDFHIGFNGNGHSIIGMKINRPEQSGIGLFGLVSSYTIKNLNLIDVDILGAGSCGGIVGSGSGDIKNCSVSGNISATSGDAGGIAGVIKGDIVNCTNLAEISGSSFAGGIAGDIEGDILLCSNHGDIWGSGLHPIGGIAGVTDGLIENCYNTGDLDQNPDGDHTGGIAGWHYSSIYTYVNCYNVGHATYGISGCGNTTLWSNCYYLEDVAENAGSYGEPLTSLDLMQASSYDGFNFTSIWTMDGEKTFPYAELQGVIQPPVIVTSTFDQSEFGNDSTIYIGTIETGKHVKITNKNKMTCENVQIICLEGVSLTLDDVDIFNSTAYLPALSFTGANNHLILEGSSSLDCNTAPGIKVESGTSLEISGTGQIESSGNTGIGARDEFSAGNITISSGLITAIGKLYGAGIGGGRNGDGGNILITGGTVVSTGGIAGGAGIGSGYVKNADREVDGGTITIAGGEVIAKGGDNATGIGGGSGGNGGIISISGGLVTSTGSWNAAGIGGGSGGTAGTINISGGTVYAQKGSNWAIHDIGYGYNKPGGSLSISGEAIVFLKSGDSLPPASLTHSYYSTAVASQGKAFGLSLPDSWTAPVYAYFNTGNVFSLEYDRNGGSGVLPEIITQYNDTTASIAIGSSLNLDGRAFMKWNTKADGTGISYDESENYIFSANQILYATYKDLTQIESTVYSVDRARQLLKNVSINTSVSHLKDNLSNDASLIRVLSSDGTEYTGSKVASGMLVQLISDEVVQDELTVSILADISGDGLIDVTDILYIRASILKAYSFSPFESNAGDVNQDMLIDINDILYIRAHILGTYDIQ